jgi:NAD-dependent deacetylase
MKKKLVVLTGAGMSAESGIATFRDSNGLWENHSIEDVATPQGWKKNPQLVLDFYNQRRKQLLEVQPNEGHRILARMEQVFDVQIITQNVDDLHERAGSTEVLHLHGELRKVRSSLNPSLVHELEGWELRWGDLAEDGAQLRPHIVWFGEDVPLINTAAELVALADIFVVVGTSLQVYPAAGLIHEAGRNVPKYIIDPNLPEAAAKAGLHVIARGASAGLAELYGLLTQIDTQ